MLLIDIKIVKEFIEAREIHNIEMLFYILKCRTMTNKLLITLFCIKAENSLKTLFLDRIQMHG